MRRRGFTCVGSLPVGSRVDDIDRYLAPSARPDLVIVNGEGTLHHAGRNCQRLLEVCHKLQASYPVVLINALWESVESPLAGEVLKGFESVYTRDRQSQHEIQGLGTDAGYAPDMTFYNYPNGRERNAFLWPFFVY